MNFVFISPQYPHTYWSFCDRLKRRGVTVLGIGDKDYAELSNELKASLTEYYKVDTLENYDQVFRGVAFFSFKYGKIDWLESCSEYWQEQDARLRTDFHITTGANAKEVAAFKNKIGMKTYYAAAGVPTVRSRRLTTSEAAKDFIKKVGYPVVIKPENAEGAADVHIVQTEADLKRAFSVLQDGSYVIEEYIEGDICAYDAITDSQCRPLFESMTVWPPAIADLVSEKQDLAYYTADVVPEALAKLGSATARALGARSRFVHIEFFRLAKARPGLGDVGDFVGMEANLCPTGGYTPDMINYAQSTDVYQIWADMVTADSRLLPESEGRHFCVYASRRDIYQYAHAHEEILARYGSQIVMCERMPSVAASAMGNQMYTAHAADLPAVLEFIQFVHEKA